MQNQLHPARFIEEALEDQRVLGGHRTERTTALVEIFHHLFGGSERQALAAYYQGARALQDAGFLPGTKQYVDDILALKTRF